MKSGIISATCSLGSTVLVTLLLCTIVSAGEYPKTFTAWQGSTPKLDGYISPGEWDDAEFQTGVADWNGNDGPTITPDDLSLRHWMKHDGENLYIAFDVNDSVIYGFDTERYEPDEEYNFPPVHQLTQDGRPWYGDGIEFMVNAANSWGDTDTRPGDGSAWQMVCSTHKSRLYGLDAGGLLEGEPRSSDYAWNNYQQWILNGDMVASVRVKSHEEGRGYVIEWMVKPDPCLEQTPGSFWNPANGVAEMGLTYELNDLDTYEEGSGRLNFHHVLLWASSMNKAYLKNYGTLRLEPGPNPALAVAEAAPELITLDQNSPNPFNPTTTISFTVENSGPASLNVYSVTGQHVKTLLVGTISPENHNVIWDGTDSQGRKVSPGLYLYHLNTDGASLTRKMLLIK